MKKTIILVVVVIVITTTLTFLVTNYFNNKQELASETANAEVICTTSSCTDSSLYYGTQAGRVIENYELTDLDGNVVNLYDLMEGYTKILISLQANWCSDCHRQDDKIIEMYNSGEIDDDTLIIPVFTSYTKSDEKVGNLENAKVYFDETFANTDIVGYYDVDDILWNDFEASGTPTNIVVNGQGRIKAVTLEYDADILLLENTDEPYISN